MDKRLYHETCRYVDRVQETLGQRLTVEEWAKVVENVYKQMEFLVPTDSAQSVTSTKENRK